MSTDGSTNRFDELTRALARGANRREVVLALAAGAASAVLAGWIGPRPAVAGDEDGELLGGGCRPDGTPCRFRRQCCSRNCVDAACRCRNEGIRCRSSAQCCSELCEKGICNCRDFGDPCTEDANCCGENPPTNVRRRAGPDGIKELNLTCQKGTCTCSFPGDPCSTSEDCCFSDNNCIKGFCQFNKTTTVNGQKRRS